MTDRDDSRAHPGPGDWSGGEHSAPYQDQPHHQPPPYQGQPPAGWPGGPGGPVAPWPSAGAPYGGAPYGPTGPYPGPYPGYGPPAVPIIAPKSVGVAVLLSFLWLGAGHLYAGRIATGVILLFVDLILWMMSFFIITLILTIPVWLILVPIAMITSAGAVKEHNQALGYYGP